MCTNTVSWDSVETSSSRNVGVAVEKSLGLRVFSVRNCVAEVTILLRCDTASHREPVTE